MEVAVPQPRRGRLGRRAAGIDGRPRRTLRARGCLRRHPDRPARRGGGGDHHRRRLVRPSPRRCVHGRGAPGSRRRRAADGVRPHRSQPGSRGSRHPATHASRRRRRVLDHDRTRIRARRNRSWPDRGRPGTGPGPRLPPPRPRRFTDTGRDRPSGRTGTLGRRHHPRPLFRARRRRSGHDRFVARPRLAGTFERDGGRPGIAADPGADRPGYPAGAGRRRRAGGSRRPVRPDASHDLPSARDRVRPQAGRQGRPAQAHEHAGRDPLRDRGGGPRSGPRRGHRLDRAGKTGRPRRAANRPPQHLPDQRPDRGGGLGHGHVQRGLGVRGRSGPHARRGPPGGGTARPGPGHGRVERVAAAAGLVVGAASGGAR